MLKVCLKRRRFCIYSTAAAGLIIGGSRVENEAPRNGPVAAVRIAS